MSIASYLQITAQSLSNILEDINTALVAKGSTAAATLDGVDEKIQAISGGGGIIPTGTRNISANGDYDVTTYASAHVAVPQGITPTGEISITENGTYNVTNYASAEVAVAGSSPTGTTNIITNGTHNVAAYAYANVNVPTGTSRSASDITVSGPTVTVPAGLYSSQATKTVSSGTQPNPTISVNSSTGVITASYSQSAGYVSSATKSATQSLTTKSAQTYTPGTTNQTISSGQYLTGTQTISGDSNLVASKIKHGVSIFGVTGSYPSGTKSITSNGSSIDVQDYAYVDVNVSSSATGYEGVSASFLEVDITNISASGSSNSIVLDISDESPYTLGYIVMHSSDVSEVTTHSVMSLVLTKRTTQVGNQHDVCIICTYGDDPSVKLDNISYSSNRATITTSRSTQYFDPYPSAYKAYALVGVPY